MDVLTHSHKYMEARQHLEVFLLVCFAMFAFAANSFFSRLALTETTIDPATFILIRIVSGALVLWLLSSRSLKLKNMEGSWTSSFALFVYAGAFSFAYLELQTGMGALVLFGMVQITMTSYAIFCGEKIRPLQWLGFVMAISGFVLLTLPGTSSPPINGFILMVVAGIAWGVYSILGRSSQNPLATTCGNFIRALPFCFCLSVIFIKNVSIDSFGVIYAVASGAIASGLGYTIWYRVLPSLQSIAASTVQLSVPILASLLGVFFLSEMLSLRFYLCALIILGGILLVILSGVGFRLFAKQNS